MLWELSTNNSFNTAPNYNKTAAHAQISVTGPFKFQPVLKANVINIVGQQRFT